MSLSAQTLEQLQTLWPDLETGQPEAVHRARKLSRKVDATLKLISAPRKVCHAWRDLRRALAPLRDHDITGQHIVSILQQQRATKTVIKAFEADWAHIRQQMSSELKLPKLQLLTFDDRKLNKADAAASSADTKLAKVAQTDLVRQAALLLTTVPAVLESSQMAQWHEVRKALKQYRHTLELVETPSHEITTALDAFGQLQDTEVVIHALASRQDWTFGDADPLIQQQTQQQQAAQSAIRELWPALSAQLSRQVHPV